MEADYELYNIAADPGETKNLYRPDDDMAQDLAKRLEEWLSSFEARPDTKLDSETKRLLRSLGYMNERGTENRSLAGLSLGRVASQQSPLAFHPATPW